MNIELTQGDITQMHVDAIVNAANSSLLGGGGVDGAIHRAGGKAILEDCQKIRNRQGGCKVGEAVITTAGLLPAQYVIHTVGPVWHDGNQQEEALLYAAYTSCLSLAHEHGIQTMAFPNISTGIYRFPKKRAAAIALAAIKDFSTTSSSIKTVILVCYDVENYHIYHSLLQ